MAKKIKWGVIGSGGIARTRTIPEGIIPSQIAELVVVSNNEVAREFNVSFANDVHSIAQAEIDAVYIASPVHKHVGQVIVLARAKKHVLCEKPLGLTVEEAEEINRVCDAEGVLLGTGLMMRFSSQHQAVFDMIKAGKLGQLVYGRAQLSCWYPPIKGAWRQNPQTGGGGSLMDMGSHCIDLLEWLFGEIKAVSCYTNNNVHPYESEDSAVVSLQFMNGAFATVDTYFCIPDDSSKNILEIYGTKGSIIAQGTLGQAAAGKMTAYFDSKNSGYNDKQARKDTDGMAINPTPKNTYLSEIEEFSRGIFEGRQPSNSGKIGLRNQKVLSACYQSAQTGQIIFLNGSKNE